MKIRLVGCAEVVLVLFFCAGVGLVGFLRIGLGASFLVTGSSGLGAGAGLSLLTGVLVG